MPDEVVIEVSLDIDKLKEAAPKIKAEVQKAVNEAAPAAKDGGKKIGKEMAAGVEDGFKTVKDFLKTGGILTAISGALVALHGLAKSAAAATVGFDELNQKTNISVRTLSALKVALATNGTTLSAFSQGMVQLQKNLLDARDGNQKLIFTFNRLGIDINNTSEGALRAIIKRFNELPDGIEKTALATKLFGETGADLIPVFKEANGNLEDYTQKMERLGLTVTPQAVESAKEYERQERILIATWEQVKVAFGLFILPAFIGLIKVVNDAGLAMRELTSDTNQAINKLTALAAIVTNPTSLALFGGGGISKPPPLGTSASAGTTLLDMLKGQPTEGGTNLRSKKFRGGGINDALKEAKQLQDALFAQERAALENENKLAQSARDRQLAILNDYYNDGKDATRVYYAERLELTQAGFRDEIKLVDLEVRQLRKTLEATPAKDRDEIVKLNTRINDLLTERTLLFDELNEAATEHSRILLRTFSEAGLVTSPSGIKLLKPTLEQGRTVLETAISPQEVQERRETKELAEADQRLQLAKLDLVVEQRRIQEAITSGALTQVEGEQRLLGIERERRDALIEALRAKQALSTTTAVDFAEIEIEIERVSRLGVELDNAQRFMRGFGSETEAVGDIFERFGQNVARSFTNIKTLFDSLKNAVKTFFADLLGNSLQKLVRGTLSAIFNPGSGGGGIAGSFSALGGGGGGFGSSAGSGIIGTLGSIFSGGGGITAPASISGGLPIAPLLSSGSIFGGGAVGGGFGGGSLGAASGGFLSKLFGGAGGLLGPLLGASLGSGIGGTSGLGNILGGIGGAAAGLGLSFGASVFGALGGGLGALGPAALAALGPIGLIAAPLLIGGFFLGKAKQRKADESASGDFLTQAINATLALKDQIKANKLEGSEARAFFEGEILQTFVDQINTLKTKSVRESRLTNQVRDLRALFESQVQPAIDEQLKRRAAALAAQALFGKLIPEFGIGGMVQGIDRGFDSVLALLQPGEMILNQAQQARMRMMAGSDIFSAVGVPGQGLPTDTRQTFATGGIAARSAGSSREQPILVDVTLAVGTDTQDQLFVSTVRRDIGRKAVAGAVRASAKNRDL